MITPIDVVDSAVKIGLGAAISGVATYWLAKASHNKGVEKERAQRKRDMLEGIAQHVAAFNHVANSHWAAVINWLDLIPPSELMSQDQDAELAKLEMEINAAGEHLISADAKLLLLGETKCYALLRDYDSSIILFRRESVAAREITVDYLLKYREDVRKKRERFFAALSDVYRQT